MKLLLIEDEKALATSIQNYFQRENFICEWASDYETALEKINIYRYDCVLVDIMLPDGDGLSAVRELKKKFPDTGIIIISAKNSLDDKLKGLNLGADDYLTKPFHMAELTARVKSVLRRKSFHGKNLIVIGNLKLDPEERSLLIADQPLVLNRKEFDILTYMVVNRNRLVNKTSLAEHVWGDHMDQADDYEFIYSQIKNLRKKLKEHHADVEIQAVYGIGYKLVQV